MPEEFWRQEKAKGEEKGDNDHRGNLPSDSRRQTPGLAIDQGWRRSDFLGSRRDGDKILLRIVESVEGTIGAVSKAAVLDDLFTQRSEICLLLHHESLQGGGSIRSSGRLGAGDRCDVLIYLRQKSTVLLIGK